MDIFSANLKKAMWNKNITPHIISLQSNMSEEDVRLFLAEEKEPTLAQLKQLAGICGCTIDYLVYPLQKKQPRYLLWSSTFFVVIFIIGGAYSVPIFASFFGGGIAEQFLYPIYFGIIMLGILILICTASILNAISEKRT